VVCSMCRLSACYKAQTLSTATSSMAKTWRYLPVGPVASVSQQREVARYIDQFDTVNFIVAIFLAFL